MTTRYLNIIKRKSAGGIRPRFPLVPATKESRLAIWRAAQSIWKKRKIDPVKYQRKLRREADHIKI